MRIFADPRTGIKYADLIIGGKRRRVSLKTKDNKVAILRASKLADDKEAEREGKTSLAAFLGRLKEYNKATRKDNTQYRYELAWRDFLNWRPFKFLDQITPAVMDEFAVHQKAKLKGTTAAGLNRNIRALKTSMRQAEFWELIPPQNWRKVSKFKENKGRVEYHTEEEIKEILAIFNPDWQVAIRLGFQAGLRRGEMAALKWKDVDFKNNQIYVAPNKTEGHRYVPMVKKLHKALLAAKKRAKKGTEYVLNLGEDRNSPYYLSIYYLKRTKEKLPFKCGLHKLRHTFASHLVQNGVDLYRVSKLLGHTSIQMTEIYAHLAPQDLKSAVERLPNI